MKRRAKRIAPVPQNGSITRKIKLRIGLLGYGREVPPHPNFVDIYFDQQQLATEAERFFKHYEKMDWKTITGTPIRNWKVIANDWIFDHRQQQKRTERLNKF